MVHEVRSTDESQSTTHSEEASELEIPVTSSDSEVSNGDTSSSVPMALRRVQMMVTELRNLKRQTHAQNLCAIFFSHVVCTCSYVCVSEFDEYESKCMGCLVSCPDPPSLCNN